MSVSARPLNSNHIVAQQATLSIVIVNYQTPKLTQACLEHLRQHLDFKRVQVIVVDNNSRDDSTRYLRCQTDITLLERAIEKPETGYEAHGRGIDLAMKHVRRPYVLLMHTDTFILDASLLWRLLDLMIARPRLIAAGCCDQRPRSYVSKLWRKSKKFVRYQRRKITHGHEVALRQYQKDSKLKSFFCLYNAESLKADSMRFCEGKQNPSYVMQERFPLLGYQVLAIPTKLMFQGVAHVQAGTRIEASSLAGGQNRIASYEKLLKIERRSTTSKRFNNMELMLQACVDGLKV